MSLNPHLAWPYTHYLRAGRISVRETVVNGIERAPEAFLAILRGEHVGKVSGRVAPDQDGTYGARRHC